MAHYNTVSEDTFSDLTLVRTNMWCMSTDDALIMIEAARTQNYPLLTIPYSDTNLNSYIDSGSILIFARPATVNSRLYWRDRFSWYKRGHSWRSYMIYIENHPILVPPLITMNHYLRLTPFNSDTSDSNSGEDTLHTQLAIEYMLGLCDSLGLDCHGLIKRNILKLFTLQLKDIEYRVVSYLRISDVLNGTLQSVSKAWPFSNIVPGDDLIAATCNQLSLDSHSELWANTMTKDRWSYTANSLFHNILTPECYNQSTDNSIKDEIICQAFTKIREIAVT
ncbi:hypothetical protein K474DRAFT_1680384 [Panus rudis PR-1116 ss-1]|nr:hypothetical protein K474DRAFT_1680384 [Panus rudis PR-1116 ss-1]